MEVTMYKQTENVDPKFEEARSHMQAARKAFRSSVKAFFPPGFVEQRRKARREMLLAMRSLVDGAIDHLYKIEKPEETKV